MKKRKVIIPLLLQPWFLLFLGLFLFTGVHMAGASFTVDTTIDSIDAAPGDGMAADADGNCSLRAAIMEANALAGPDAIEVPLLRSPAPQRHDLHLPRHSPGWQRYGGRPIRREVVIDIRRC